MEIEPEPSQPAKSEIEEFIIPASQFICTQAPKAKPPVHVHHQRQEPQLNEVTEIIDESFEDLTEELNINNLKILNDKDIVKLVNKMSMRLNFNETYTLCNLICDMETDIAIQYLNIVCTKLILDKVI